MEDVTCSEQPPHCQSKYFVNIEVKIQVSLSYKSTVLLYMPYD